MQRLGPRLQGQSASSMHLPAGFGLDGIRFVHPEPDPFWEPNQGGGDLSELDPKSTLLSQNEALMWTKGRALVYGRRSNVGALVAPRYSSSPLARDPHLCCTGG